MWLALLLLTWSIELAVGGWFLYAFWTTQAFSVAGISEPGPGFSVLYTYQALSHPFRHPYPLTQVEIARFLLLIFALLHALALVRGLSQPARERLRLGVRRQHTESDPPQASLRLRQGRAREQPCYEKAPGMGIPEGDRPRQQQCGERASEQSAIRHPRPMEASAPATFPGCTPLKPPEKLSTNQRER